MRDRLIELIAEGRELCEQIPCEGCTRSCKGLNDCVAKVQADHLLANGVIVPPCYVGQPVWKLRKWLHKDAEICTGKVSMLQQKADKSWKIRISVNSSVYDITPDEIGKTVFLTREEAERAVKGGAE